MSDIATNSARKKWGDEASARFVRFPFELLMHYQDIALTADNLVILLWIDFHQWGEKAAFPHPAKLADALGISEHDALSKLKELEEKGYITLEQTKSNKSNYYQDLRPTRNLLRKYLKDNPSHCDFYKTSTVSRIDTSRKVDISTKRQRDSTDTSILAKPQSMEDILKSKRKKL